MTSTCPSPTGSGWRKTPGEGRSMEHIACRMVAFLVTSGFYNEHMVITTSPLVKTYTLQEFWNLPEPADRAKLELIKGVLYMSPPPGEIHDEICSALYGEFKKAIDGCGCKGMILVPRAAVWIDD